MVPLGAWSEDMKPFLKILQEYATAFYGNMPVKMLKKVSLEVQITTPFAH
jgi:hypothetical protein